MNKYQPVIGLEVHVELKTKSKMFCGCSAEYFGKEPNTHCCPVCLGMPGALPVPNKKAIEWCVMIGQALNCEIPEFSKFDRKNYFYPDLAKGYQISQYDKPFCINGWIDITGHPERSEGSLANARTSDKLRDSSPAAQNDNKKKRIRIRRVHMEEDTAKLTHAEVGGEKVSLIDFNRSGVPLVEIVTEPDFESTEEVVEYLKKLQQIVRYLDVSNADMEKGDMRLEPNISLKVRHPERSEGSLANARTSDKLRDSSPPAQNDIPGYKVEVKNINSFRFVDKAIAYEIKRQTELLEKGETPKQETRGWNEPKNATLSQRGKEEAHDYRYFPEPDIPPIRWEQSQISHIKSQIGELPDIKLKRFIKQYALSQYDAEILTREKRGADYFEEAVRVGKEHDANPKQIANYLINKKVDIENVLPAQAVAAIISAGITASISEAELEEIVRGVIAEHKDAVADYKSGKEPVLMFLLGQVMRRSKVMIDANLVKEKLKEVIGMSS